MLDLWFLKQNKTHNFFFKRKNRMILDDIGNFNYMKFLKYPLEKKYIEDGINYNVLSIISGLQRSMKTREK
jgi:hypothetical protein